MSRFDKTLEKFDVLEKADPEYVKSSLSTLLEMRDTIKEGVDHYRAKEDLNDQWHDWYTNARVHWQNKLEKIDVAITKLNAANVKNELQEIK